MGNKDDFAHFAAKKATPCHSTTKEVSSFPFLCFLSKSWGKDVEQRKTAFFPPWENALSHNCCFNYFRQLTSNCLIQKLCTCIFFLVTTCQAERNLMQHPGFCSQIFIYKLGCIIEWFSLGWFSLLCGVATEMPAVLYSFQSRSGYMSRLLEFADPIKDLDPVCRPGF